MQYSADKVFGTQDEVVAGIVRFKRTSCASTRQ